MGHLVVGHLGRHLLDLALLGLAVGIACWPLNLVDRWQDQLLQILPGFSGEGWSRIGLLLVFSPLVVVPLLLALQAGPWADGRGSGIPQTMSSLHDPAAGDQLLARGPTLRRCLLWTAASLSLLSLGREGPVVQVGASVAHALRRWRPGLLRGLVPGGVLAIAAGAGLAGGFNSHLMGVVFMAEELTGRFQASLIWPGLVVCATAALMSHWGGEPIYGLGVIANTTPETELLLLAIPIGITAGLLGGAFSRLLLAATAWLRPQVRRRPWLWGAGLGLLISLLLFASGGFSGGDGESLMRRLIHDPDRISTGWPLLGTLAVRLLAPVLALAGGIPGGLIDPAFTLGAVYGSGVIEWLGGDPHVGLALGMVASLAGATQLPVMSMLFALHMAGDQQLLAGLVVAAALGAYAGRLLLKTPIYHALAELEREASDLEAERRAQAAADAAPEPAGGEQPRLSDPALLGAQGSAGLFSSQQEPEGTQSEPKTAEAKPDGANPAEPGL
ncbi:MAG: chloride channel protein [Prochlorococcaceae cyanobacterium]